MKETEQLHAFFVYIDSILELVDMLFGDMYCTNCGKELPSTDARFCMECGTAVETEPICSNCGNILPYFVKYCPKCGERTKGLVFNCLNINYMNVDQLDLKDIYIKYLCIYKSKLGKLKLHNIKGLAEIEGEGGVEILTLDIDGNIEQNELKIFGLGLTHLNINSTFSKIKLFDNRIISLDMSHNTALTKLDFFYIHEFTSLNLSHNIALSELFCYDARLTSLDLSNNTALTKLYCQVNRLTSLDLSNNTALTKLCCDDNQLTSLDLRNNKEVTELSCKNNPLTKLIIPRDNNIFDSDMQKLIEEYGNIIEYIE